MKLPATGCRSGSRHTKNTAYHPETGSWQQRGVWDNSSRGNCFFKTQSRPFSGKPGGYWSTPTAYGI